MKLTNTPLVNTNEIHQLMSEIGLLDAIPNNKEYAAIREKYAFFYKDKKLKDEIAVSIICVIIEQYKASEQNRSLLDVTSHGKLNEVAFYHSNVNTLFFILNESDTNKTVPDSFYYHLIMWLWINIDQQFLYIQHLEEHQLKNNKLVNAVLKNIEIIRDHQEEYDTLIQKICTSSHVYSEPKKDELKDNFFSYFCESSVGLEINYLYIKYLINGLLPTEFELNHCDDLFDKISNKITEEKSLAIKKSIQKLNRLISTSSEKKIANLLRILKNDQDKLIAVLKNFTPLSTQTLKESISIEENNMEGLLDIEICSLDYEYSFSGNNAEKTLEIIKRLSSSSNIVNNKNLLDKLSMLLHYWKRYVDYATITPHTKEVIKILNTLISVCQTTQKKINDNLTWQNIDVIAKKIFKLAVTLEVDPHNPNYHDAFHHYTKIIADESNARTILQLAIHYMSDEESEIKVAIQSHKEDPSSLIVFKKSHSIISIGFFCIHHIFNLHPNFAEKYGSIHTILLNYLVSNGLILSKSFGPGESNSVNDLLGKFNLFKHYLAISNQYYAYVFDNNVNKKAIDAEQHLKIVSLYVGYASMLFFTHQFTLNLSTCQNNFTLLNQIKLLYASDQSYINLCKKNATNHEAIKQQISNKKTFTEELVNFYDSLPFFEEKLMVNKGDRDAHFKDKIQNKDIQGSFQDFNLVLNCENKESTLKFLSLYIEKFKQHQKELTALPLYVSRVFALNYIEIIIKKLDAINVEILKMKIIQTPMDSLAQQIKTLTISTLNYDEIAKNIFNKLTINNIDDFDSQMDKITIDHKNELSNSETTLQIIHLILSYANNNQDETKPETFKIRFLTCCFILKILPFNKDEKLKTSMICYLWNNGSAFLDSLLSLGLIPNKAYDQIILYCRKNLVAHHDFLIQLLNNPSKKSAPNDLKFNAEGFYTQLIRQNVIYQVFLNSTNQTLESMNTLFETQINLHLASGKVDAKEFLNLEQTIIECAGLYEKNKIEKSSVDFIVGKINTHFSPPVALQTNDTFVVNKILSLESKITSLVTKIINQPNSISQHDLMLSGLYFIKANQDAISMVKDPHYTIFSELKKLALAWKKYFKNILDASFPELDSIYQKCSNALPSLGKPIITEKQKSNPEVNVLVIETDSKNLGPDIIKNVSSIIISEAEKIEAKPNNEKYEAILLKYQQFLTISDLKKNLINHIVEKLGVEFQEYQVKTQKNPNTKEYLIQDIDFFTRKLNAVFFVFNKMNADKSNTSEDYYLSLILLWGNIEQLSRAIDLLFKIKGIDQERYFPLCHLINRTIQIINLYQDEFNHFLKKTFSGEKYSFSQKRIILSKDLFYHTVHASVTLCIHYGHILYYFGSVNQSKACVVSATKQLQLIKGKLSSEEISELAEYIDQVKQRYTNSKLSSLISILSNFSESLIQILNSFLTEADPLLSYVAQEVSFDLKATLQEEINKLSGYIKNRKNTLNERYISSETENELKQSLALLDMLYSSSNHQDNKNLLSKASLLLIYWKSYFTFETPDENSIIITNLLDGFNKNIKSIIDKIESVEIKNNTEVKSLLSSEEFILAKADILHAVSLSLNINSENNEYQKLYDKYKIYFDHKACLKEISQTFILAIKSLEAVQKEEASYELETHRKCIGLAKFGIDKLLSLDPSLLKEADFYKIILVHGIKACSKIAKLFEHNKVPVGSNISYSNELIEYHNSIQDYYATYCHKDMTLALEVDTTVLKFLIDVCDSLQLVGKTKAANILACKLKSSIAVKPALDSNKAEEIKAYAKKLDKFPVKESNYLMKALCVLESFYNDFSGDSAIIKHPLTEKINPIVILEKEKFDALQLEIDNLARHQESDFLIIYQKIMTSIDLFLHVYHYSDSLVVSVYIDKSNTLLKSWQSYFNKNKPSTTDKLILEFITRIIESNDHSKNILKQDSEVEDLTNQLNTLSLRPLGPISNKSAIRGIDSIVQQLDEAKIHDSLFSAIHHVKLDTKPLLLFFENNKISDFLTKQFDLHLKNHNLEKIYFFRLKILTYYFFLIQFGDKPKYKNQCNYLKEQLFHNLNDFYMLLNQLSTTHSRDTDKLKDFMPIVNQVNAVLQINTCGLVEYYSQFSNAQKKPDIYDSIIKFNLTQGKYFLLCKAFTDWAPCYFYTHSLLLKNIDIISVQKYNENKFTLIGMLNIFKKIIVTPVNALYFLKHINDHFNPPEKIILAKKQKHFHSILTLNSIKKTIRILKGHIAQNNYIVTEDDLILSGIYFTSVNQYTQDKLQDDPMHEILIELKNLALAWKEYLFRQSQYDFETLNQIIEKCDKSLLILSPQPKVVNQIAEPITKPNIKNNASNQNNQTNAEIKKAQLHLKKERKKQRAEELKAERIQAEKLEVKQREIQKLAAEKLEAEKREAEKREAEKREAEKREAERREAERREAERREAEKRDAEKREAEKREAEKREAEKREAEKREAEKREAEKREAEKREAEKREAEKREAEKREAEKREAEKREAEKREAEKREAEKREAEKREAEKRLAEQLAVKQRAIEKRALIQQNKLEAQRLEAQKLENQRLEAEKINIEGVLTDSVIFIPNYAKQLATLLEEAGFEADFVGGYLRDTLLTVEPDDIDIVTNCTIDKIRLVLRNYLLIQNQHVPEFFKINFDKEMYNVDIVCQPLPLKNFLSKKDFTLNMLTCKKDGRIRDYFSCMKDFDTKTWRSLEEINMLFENHPDMALRALRLAPHVKINLPSYIIHAAIIHAHLFCDITFGINICNTGKLFLRGDGEVILDLLIQNRILTSVIPFLEENDIGLYYHYWKNLLSKIDGLSRKTRKEKFSPVMIIALLLLPLQQHVDYFFDKHTKITFDEKNKYINAAKKIYQDFYHYRLPEEIHSVVYVQLNTPTVSNHYPYEPQIECNTQYYPGTLYYSEQMQSPQNYVNNNTPQQPNFQAQSLNQNYTHHNNNKSYTPSFQTTNNNAPKNIIHPNIQAQPNANNHRVGNTQYSKNTQPKNNANRNNYPINNNNLSQKNNKKQTVYPQSQSRLIEDVRFQNTNTNTNTNNQINSQPQQVFTIIHSNKNTQANNSPSQNNNNQNNTPNSNNNNYRNNASQSKKYNTNASNQTINILPRIISNSEHNVPPQNKNLHKVRNAPKK